MNIQNPGWAGYFDRTYDQIKTNVLTIFQSLVPEITDDTETNPWVKGISIWSALVEMLGYYVDTNAREYFLPVAREFASGIKLAKAYDYRVKGAIPSTVTLRFTSNIAATGSITIPIGTRVKTSNGEIFTTITAGTITIGNTHIDVQARQWDAVINVALGNSTGLADQFYPLEEDVADGSVTVKVGVITYQSQETFAFSLPADTHFVAGLQEDTKMQIRFSDGVNGIIPPGGSAIIASYYVTLGADGNVGAGKINTILSTISVPGSEIMSVANALSSTGGASFEDLPHLQKRLPLSIRTKYRAVTKQDFIDLAELVGGVERAGCEFDCDVSVFVNIYIVPEGGGIASGGLLTDVFNYLSDRKIINARILVESAGIVQFIITANVTALPGFSNAAVKSDVENAILAFFAPENQLIKGSVIIGDIYEQIEDTMGVQNSIITLIVPVPYAQNLTTPANSLNWTRAINPASNATVKWLIRFLSNSTFELYNETDFVGTFSVDTPIVATEINFTVNGNHLGGDNYQFYTYAYNVSTVLAEPSIPAALLANLTINVSGGV